MEGRRKKKTSPKSNPLNYSTLERDPRSTLPLVNQSQQIAVVNISDSADLDRDIATVFALAKVLSNNIRGLQPAQTLRQLTVVGRVGCRGRRANTSTVRHFGKLIGSIA